jgi:hypothetical protein
MAVVEGFGRLRWGGKCMILIHGSLGVAMPIRPLPRQYNFRLELIQAMRTAYRMACEAPQIKGTDDTFTAIVAEKIIELAEAGRPIQIVFAAAHCGGCPTSRMRTFH